jgi:hypothetical protein
MFAFIQAAILSKINMLCIKVGSYH